MKGTATLNRSDWCLSCECAKLPNKINPNHRTKQRQITERSDAKSPKSIDKMKSYMGTIKKICGVILIISGLVMVFNGATNINKINGQVSAKSVIFALL